MGRGELLHFCQFSRPLKWAELPLYLGPEHDIRQVDHAFLRLCFLKFSLRFVKLTSRFMVVTLCITSWPMSCIMHVNIKWIVHYLIPSILCSVFFLIEAVFSQLLSPEMIYTWLPCVDIFFNIVVFILFNCFYLVDYSLLREVAYICNSVISKIFCSRNKALGQGNSLI